MERTSRFFVDAPQSSQPDTATSNVAAQPATPDESTFRKRTLAAPRRPPRARDSSRSVGSDKTKMNESAQKKKLLPSPRPSKRDGTRGNETQTGVVAERDSPTGEQANGTVAGLVNKIESVSKGEASPGESRSMEAVRPSPPTAPKSQTVVQTRKGASPPIAPKLVLPKNGSSPTGLKSRSAGVQSENGSVGSQSNVTSTSTVTTSSPVDGSSSKVVSPVVMRRKPEAKQAVAGGTDQSTSLALGKMSAGVEASRKSVMHSPKLVGQLRMSVKFIADSCIWRLQFRSSKTVKSIRKSKASPDQPEVSFP